LPDRVIIGAVSLCVLLALFLGGAETISEQRQADFLRDAKVVKGRVVGKGITETWRLMLKDDVLTHDASFQYVDETAPIKNIGHGRKEVGFVDSYRYNIAAYRLAALVGMSNMVPVSVERSWRGKTGAMTWWVDDVAMDEAEMDARGVKPPEVKFWTEQIHRVRVFSELIYDTDRNKSNLLITKDWKIWMIDFSRAFRRWPKIRNPAWLLRCDERVFTILEGLTRGELDEALSDILRRVEIEGVWARRALIVAHYEKLIAERGRDQVLY